MAARPVVRELEVPDGPRHRGLRRREPRLPDRLLERRQGLPQVRRPEHRFVGGTSAATPLVAGMIALWNQQAKQQGLPRPGFVPPLLYATAKRNPGAFIDITEGGNALFGGSCCPARPGLRPRHRTRLPAGESNRTRFLDRSFAGCRAPGVRASRLGSLDRGGLRGRFDVLLHRSLPGVRAADRTGGRRRRLLRRLDFLHPGGRARGSGGNTETRASMGGRSVVVERSDPVRGHLAVQPQHL